MTAPKKRVSAADLCWVITDQIRQFGPFTRTLSVAVVPDATDGWRIVVGRRRKSALTPEFDHRLGELERKLRQSYALTD